MQQKTSKRHFTRQVILKALYQWSITKIDFDALAGQFEEYSDQIDKGYFLEVVKYILENFDALDSEYKPFLDRGIDKLDPIIESILRLGAYELNMQKELPYKVVLNEALNLSKEFGSEDSHKFVNGVLDKLAKKVRNNETS